MWSHQKSLKNLLLSSEITIKLKNSKLYLRLVLVSYLMTLGLLYCSPTYLSIKLLLSLLVFCHGLVTIKNTSVKVSDLVLSANEWTLLMSDGQKKPFDKVNIVIHNELFQLIKFTNTPTSRRSKLVVIFNDQLTPNQLRLMHLKIATSTNLC